MSEPENVVEWRQTDTLRPYEKNTKRHPPEQVNKIAASIREHGWRAKPIEILADGTIVNGHGRWMAAQSLGHVKVPVVVIADMTPAQVRKYRMDDNIVAVSDFDTDLMSQEINDLITIGMDLSNTFDKRSLDFAIQDLGKIDIGAITADLRQQVNDQSNLTQNQMDENKGREVPLAKAFGFAKVSGAQERPIALLMAHAEAMTGLKGAEALVLFIQDHLGLEDTHT